MTIEIRGHEPIPWSAGTHSRWGGTIPNTRMVGWQARVADAARTAFGPFQPWTEPLALSVRFFLKRAMPNKKAEGGLSCPVFTWDEVCLRHAIKGKASDLTNLIKAAEDAIEGIVFVNDAQVCGHGVCHKVWSVNPGMILTLSR